MWNDEIKNKINLDVHIYNINVEGVYHNDKCYENLLHFTNLDKNYTLKINSFYGNSCICLSKLIQLKCNIIISNVSLLFDVDLCDCSHITYKSGVDNEHNKSICLKYGINFIEN